MELLILGKALLHFDFDIQKTAKSLGCAASKLYQRIREHDLEGAREALKKHPLIYDPKKKLEDYKREVIQAALKYCQDSPYQAARLLKVSPGMVYQWIH